MIGTRLSLRLLPVTVKRERGRAMAHIRGDPNIIIFMERMHIEHILYINTCMRIYNNTYIYVLVRCNTMFIGIPAYWRSTIAGKWNSRTERQWDSVPVRQLDCETVWHWDSKTVRQCDSVTVRQWDSRTVWQWDGETVGQWDSETVGQCDSETVRQ